jgi:hypothetical protein
METHAASQVMALTYDQIHLCHAWMEGRKEAYKDLDALEGDMAACVQIMLDTSNPEMMAYMLSLLEEYRTHLLTHQHTEGS